jgi:hypothetical protein
MSNDLQTISSTDMSEQEQKLLAQYMEGGLVGISKVSDSDVYQAFNLYMSGKGYEEIAGIVKIPIEKVLLLAKKHDWFKKKINHLEKLHKKIGDRTAQAQIESASFLTDYIAYIHRKLGSNINQFLAGDLEAGGVSPKELEKYFKAVETLKLMMSESPPVNPPTNVVINTQGGPVSVGDPINAAIEVKSRPFQKIAEEKRAKKAAPKDPTKK